MAGAAIRRRPLWDSYKDAAGTVSKTYAASGSYSATKSRNGCFAAPSSPIYRNAPTAFGAANVCRKEHPMMDFIMLGLGLGFFALSVGYTVACDRL